MKQLLILLFICFSVLKLTAQTQWVRFSVSNPELPCEDVVKQVLISVKTGEKDSLLKKEQFLDCAQLVEVPRIEGLYYFTIRTQLYEPILLNFEVKLTTADTINLGKLLLKETASQLDEVTITGVQRKFIEIDADKTTLTVKDNPVLSVSSIYDAILKIPGVMPFPGGGFAIGSQMASVYFENVPSSLSTDDLMNLLKSLPASSVETIEIISNPGASFDANVSGAIININSIGKATKWLSGTISVNYGINQNQKVIPSLVLNGRRSKWSWQMQTGYSYNERSSHDTSGRIYETLNPQVRLSSNRLENTTSSYYYFKPSVTFNWSRRTSLLLHYNGSFGDNRIGGNNQTTSGDIPGFLSLENQYKSRNYGMGNEGFIKFRHEFDTLRRNLDITAFYSNYQNKSKRKNIQRVLDDKDYSILDYYMNIHRFYVRADGEIPFEKVKFYLNAGLKYSLMQVDNIGSYNLNNPSEALFDNPIYASVIDFDYIEDNMAAYVDLKKKFGKKVVIGMGLRTENFRLSRYSNVTAREQDNYFNLFPSFNAIYRVHSMVNIIGTYSRKIGIPRFTQYDPNNAGYYDSFSSTSGNTQLKPNFYDNAQFKITFMDYAQFAVNYTHSQFLNLSESVVEENSLKVVNTFRTYANVNSMNYFLAVPVPFVLITKGFKFLDEPIEVDKMSFLYLYSSFTKTTIGGYNYTRPNKGMWTAGAYAQIVLPWKIKLNIDYYLTGKGYYQMIEFARNRSGLDVTLSREFMDKKLKTSIAIEDIFNTEQSSTRLSFPTIYMNSYSKQDTRIVWIKLSYSFGKVEKENEGDGLQLPSNSGPGL